MITEDQVGKTKTLSCDIQWSLYISNCHPRQWKNVGWVITIASNCSRWLWTFLHKSIEWNILVHRHNLMSNILLSPIEWNKYDNFPFKPMSLCVSVNSVAKLFHCFFLLLFFNFKPVNSRFWFSRFISNTNSHWIGLVSLCIRSDLLT